MQASCDAFDLVKLFISLITSSFVILLKVNTGPLLVFLFIAKILGCLRYFDIAFKVGSLTFSIILVNMTFLRNIQIFKYDCEKIF